jgi:hypothetical protein
MAKGLMISFRDVRKAIGVMPKTIASQPTQKLGVVRGLENMRNK